MANTKTISTLILRLPPEHHKQLKIAAAENSTSIQKLIENALNSDPKTAYKPAPKKSENQAKLC